MMSRKNVNLIFVTLAGLLLAACLGEPALPEIEALPAPTLAAPIVNPTVAAAPRLSLSFGDQPNIANQAIPQIPHDLIGRSDCLMCHKQGVGDAPPTSAAHRGLESNTCQTCHSASMSGELSGAEMYTRVCARCHGENGEGNVGPALNVKSYLTRVSDVDLKAAIARGRGTGEMLAWGDLGLLSERQLDEMVALLRSWEATAPESPQPIAAEPVTAASGDTSDGEALFAQYCTGCHGIGGETAVGEGTILRESARSMDDPTLARWIRDGSELMPAFHSLLTTDDVNDLLALVRSWQYGPGPTPTTLSLSGEEIYARVCASCHGLDGAGGVGPPLNSKEFLTAYDNEGIRNWIVRGTSGTNMLSWGDLGLLNSDQIDELVAFIRAWEPTAPSTAGGPGAKQPADAVQGDPVSGQQLFAQFCSGCHGMIGERPTSGVTINTAVYLQSVTDEILASQIQNGGRAMPSFHTILTGQDVNDLLAFMRGDFSAEGSPPAATPAPEATEAPEATATPEAATTAVSFATDLIPVLETKCGMCHGAAGGWSAASYEEVMNSGQNAPVIIPGDPEGSLLIAKLLDQQTSGSLMPPSGMLPEGEIDLFVQWVASGAPDN